MADGKIEEFQCVDSNPKSDIRMRGVETMNGLAQTINILRMVITGDLTNSIGVAVF